MSGWATCPNTPSKEMTSGEGQRKIYYMAQAYLGRGKVSTSVYLWGAEESFKFKKRKNWGMGERFA
jgi:hypothetical protein